jgi:hypothetical protein
MFFVITYSVQTKCLVSHTAVLCLMWVLKHWYFAFQRVLVEFATQFYQRSVVTIRALGSATVFIFNSWHVFKLIYFKATCWVLFTDP